MDFFNMQILYFLKILFYSLTDLLYNALNNFLK